MVVSNANGTLAAHFDRLGLTAAVDLVLDSQVEGVEKPDPRLFQIALARSGASPDTTVHVGDLYHVDVVGARAAGLRAVLVDAGGLYRGGRLPARHVAPDAGRRNPRRRLRRHAAIRARRHAASLSTYE